MDRRFGSVSDVVLVFGDCLRVLTPYVSRVGIEWDDGKNYDDWDAIAQTLYATVVGGTIAYTVEGEGFGKLTPYGMIMPDYSNKSLSFSMQSGRNAPFLKLAGSELPFDTAVFLELTSEGSPTGHKLRSPLRNTEFAALLRSTDEEREIVNVIISEK